MSFLDNIVTSAEPILRTAAKGVHTGLMGADPQYAKAMERQQGMQERGQRMRLNEILTKIKMAGGLETEAGRRIAAMELAKTPEIRELFGKTDPEAGIFGGLDPYSDLTEDERKQAKRYKAGVAGRPLTRDTTHDIISQIKELNNTLKGALDPEWGGVMNQELYDDTARKLKELIGQLGKRPKVIGKGATPTRPTGGAFGALGAERGLPTRGGAFGGLGTERPGAIGGETLTAEDTKAYKDLGVKQYRTSGGKFFDFTKEPALSVGRGGKFIADDVRYYVEPPPLRGKIPGWMKLSEQEREEVWKAYEATTGTKAVESSLQKTKSEFEKAEAKGFVTVRTAPDVTDHEPRSLSEGGLITQIGRMRVDGKIITHKRAGQIVRDYPNLSIRLPDLNPAGLREVLAAIEEGMTEEEILQHFGKP